MGDKKKLTLNDRVTILCLGFLWLLIVVVVLFVIGLVNGNINSEGILCIVGIYVPVVVIGMWLQWYTEDWEWKEDKTGSGSG